MDQFRHSPWTFTIHLQRFVVEVDISILSHQPQCNACVFLYSGRQRWQSAKHVSQINNLPTHPDYQHWFSGHKYLCIIHIPLTWSVKSLRALGTSERPLFRMCYNMSAQFTRSRKRLWAVWTAVRFFTGVNEGVSFERYCRRKCLAAMFTFVRTFTCSEENHNFYWKTFKS